MERGFNKRKCFGCLHLTLNIEVNKKGVKNREIIDPLGVVCTTKS